MSSTLNKSVITIKIFIPDFTDKADKPYCVPPMYPFINGENNGQWSLLFGNYTSRITLVNTIKDCDAVLLMHEPSYYYKKKHFPLLKKMNQQAVNHGKPFICWSKGDSGITPPLKNFHLYRLGGYKSKNRGNQFAVPVFIKDPVPEYFEGKLPINIVKPKKAHIGFCGQGKAGFSKVVIDVLRGLKNRVQKLFSLYPFDIEVFSSSTYKRSRILDALEKSSSVKTNFIRYKKYRAGSTSPLQKKESSKIFFKNMSEVDYMICYRGAGNFSVRLFETMASGKIPIIITSDNNLPFEDEIEWQMFPMISDKNWRGLDKVVAEYHNKLSNEKFVELQYASRKIWEDYLTYKGFFSHWLDRYASSDANATKLVMKECKNPTN